MFDGAMTSVHSSLAIGRVRGDHREVMALVSPTATDDDVWRVVNLKSKGSDTDQFDSIAVLGAIDDDQAVEWAFNQRGRFLLDGIVLSVGETNTRGLKRYLDSERLNYRENSPIHLNQLAKLQDMTTGQPVMWDGINLKSHSSSSAVLLVDLVKHDDHSQLFDAIKADDMPALLELLGAEAMGYDALIVESRKLDTLMQRLGAAMSKATEAGVTVTNVRQSEPFKRNKVTQVAAIFEMSDGQSVSIVFHNPDSTPSKLLPQDTLISWKFLLNSRDISAAVQPNQGEDVQLPVLATRMMKLVNQNSARFARTNAKKAENVAALDEAKARIETKSQTVAALDAEIAQLQAELDKPAPVEPKTNADQNEFGGSKELQSELVKLGFNRLSNGWLKSDSLGAWRGGVGVKNAAKEQYTLSIPESIYADIPNAGNYPFQKKEQESYQDLAKRIFDKGVALNKNVVLSDSEPSTGPDEITQAEADDWNAGDEMPHQGEYQEYNGETIKYVITKPRRNAKGVLIVADKRKAGGWTRIGQLCQAKGINGRWSGVQNGYIISSEKKVEKLIDLLNTGWSASTVTGDLFAPKNTDPAPQPTPAVEPATIIASEQAMIQELQELLVSAGWTKDPKREQPFFYSPDFLFHLGISNNARLKVPSYLQILYLPPNSKEILSLPDAGGDLNFGAYSEQPEATAKDLMAFVDAEIQKAKLSINPKPAVEPEQLTTQQRTEQAFEGVKAVLAKDYGWSPRGGAPLKKAFDGAQASGSLNPDGTVYVSAYLEGINLVATVGNGMDDPKRIAFGNLPQYNLNQDSFDRVARLFNRDVENYIDARRRELKPTPAAEPEPTTTDLGNNESVSRGMANNGDGTFTAMTATQSKTFKTRAGAERWLAQRGLNPDGSKIEVAEPEPAPAPTPEEAPMPATNPDAEYLNSVISGQTPLATLADIKAVQAELKRMDAELEDNPNDEVDDLVGQAFDLVKTAAKKAMQAAA